MNAIKNKMSAKKMERENSLDRAKQLEQKVRDTEGQKVRIEEDLNNLQKKSSNLDNDFDNVNEQLQDTLSKLKHSEKRMTDMEHEVSSTTYRIRLLEEDRKREEGRLQTVTENLEEASKSTDESVRGRKVLESRNLADDERIDQLEPQLKEVKCIQRLKDAEIQKTEAERTVYKLQKEVNRLEDTLLAERERYKRIIDELDQTFIELGG